MLVSKERMIIVGQVDFPNDGSKSITNKTCAVFEATCLEDNPFITNLLMPKQSTENISPPICVIKEKHYLAQ